MHSKDMNYHKQSNECHYWQLCKLKHRYMYLLKHQQANQRDKIRILQNLSRMYRSNSCLLALAKHIFHYMDFNQQDR